MILFLTSGAYALKIIFPVEAEVFDNSTIELGKISPGQNFELIVFGEGIDVIEVSGQFSSWAEKSKFYKKNTGIRINIPKETSAGTKNLSFKAFNSKDKDSFESFNILINVQNDLWSVNISDLSQETKVDSTANYSLVFSNESIGEQKIIVSSDLPSYWFKEKSFDLEPKSVLRESVEVNPKYYGKRQFNFVFTSLYSLEKKEFSSTLLVESSLSSKYSSPLYGFPFFTPTLYTYYLAESFFSSLSSIFLK
jgi:hypothetical protein